MREEDEDAVTIAWRSPHEIRNASLRTRQSINRLGVRLFAFSGVLIVSNVAPCRRDRLKVSVYPKPLYPAPFQNGTLWEEDEDARRGDNRAEVSERDQKRASSHQQRWLRYRQHAPAHCREGLHPHILCLHPHILSHQTVRRTRSEKAPFGPAISAQTPTRLHPHILCRAFTLTSCVASDCPHPHILCRIRLSGERDQKRHPSDTGPAMSPPTPTACTGRRKLHFKIVCL